MKNLRLLLGVLIVGLFGCAQTPSARSASQGVAQAMPPAPAEDQAQSPIQNQGRAQPLLGKGTVHHVIIIFQENRSTDNLFHGLRGADTANSGLNTAGDRVPLIPVRLTDRFDISHQHSAFNTAYDGGEMDGFNLERSNCGGKRFHCPPQDRRMYAYVPPDEVRPYFAMAEDYAFADRMFSTQAGPSFPAHQYILSGTSTITRGSRLRAAENPLTPGQHFTGGCDSPPGSLVFLIDGNGTEDQQTFPCFDRPTLADLATAKHLSWRWYQAHSGAGLWNGPDAVKHIRDSSTFNTHVVAPPSRIFTDIKDNTLANVVWVTPTAAASDHAGATNGTGPHWVASVVNAIGESKYWDNTAIFVTWDDWGGWYDHVKPPQYNAYELGFRVPLIAIGPYAKKGFVSHNQHEFGSILKFTEQVFDLGTLGTTDLRSDNLADCFDFLKKPRPFTAIPTTFGPEYFLSQPISYEDPDNDF
ncbi:MAG: alkaline phosphatase family protein [Candidatus Cybelea sp.]